MAQNVPRNPADARERLRQVRANDNRIGKSRFERDGDTFDSTANDRSVIASYRARSATVIREGKASPFLLAIPAYESDTHDGTSPYTITLSHSIAKSTITDDAVVFVNGSKVAVDSIDYTNNTIEISSGANTDPIDVWYITDTPGQIEVSKEAPQSQGTLSHEVFDGPVGLLNVQDQNNQPITYRFTQSPLEGVLPADYRFRIYIDAPWVFQWEGAVAGTEPLNAIMSTPVREASEEIQGLGAAVRQDLARP